MRTEFVRFPTREARSRYVAQRFERYLRESVLDVGCFNAPLRDLLDGVRYVGLDIAGTPDIRLDLERTPTLPFKDGAFTCVLCIEVLEHLDSLHTVFIELLRVARRHIVVSLPNCWHDARLPIGRGQGSFAHYGLPVDTPRDRHKWFFNMAQARHFVESQAVRHGLHIRELFVTEPPRPAPIRVLRKLRFPGGRYANRYSQTLWTVYERPLRPR